MLRLIAQEQIETIEFGGVTFSVHVRGAGWWDDLIAKFGGTGKQDEYREAYVRGFLVGWEGVGDPNGVAIPFSVGVARSVYDALPVECANLIWQAARGRYEKQGEALGN